MYNTPIILTSIHWAKIGFLKHIMELGISVPVLSGVVDLVVWKLYKWRTLDYIWMPNKPWFVFIPWKRFYDIIFFIFQKFVSIEHEEGTMMSCFSICPQSIFHIPLCTVPSKNKQRLIKIGYAQDYTTSLHNLAFCKGEMFPWNIAAIVSVSQKSGRNNEKGNNKNLDKSLLHPHLHHLLLRVGAGLLGGQGRVREHQRLWREPPLPQV